ncbi:MAG: hypothetical protein BRC59_11585, partial [Cyanobacteria bacterium SW_4_48_29]
SLLARSATDREERVMVELFVSLAPLILAVAILVVLFLLLRRWRIPRRRLRQTSANRRLQSKLIRMLSGDRTAAERLVARERCLNPGQSEAWYWEKVISDLERDRRY